MGLPFILIMGAAVLFTIGGTGYGVYSLLREFEQPKPQDFNRCFPKLEGEILILIKDFQWFNRTCSRTCAPDADVPGCRCKLILRFDGQESVNFTVNNMTEGLQNNWTTMPYYRHRGSNLRRMHVQFGHVKLTYGLFFNSDLISITKPCQLSETPEELVDYEVLDSGYVEQKYLGRCGQITVQKIKERFLKLRSCSPLGLWWDLDDVSPKE